MDFFCKHFSELSTGELYEILRVRVGVFVVEQECPYQEIDGKDPASWHLWFQEEEGIQAYVRVLPPGVSFPEASIGRVLTVKRGAGLGLRLMEEAVRLAGEKFGPGPIRIEAQKYAQGFYEKLGFRQVSGEFLEDGIPHIQMLRE